MKLLMVGRDKTTMGIQMSEDMLIHRSYRVCKSKRIMRHTDDVTQSTHDQCVVTGVRYWHNPVTIEFKRGARK